MGNADTLECYLVMFHPDIRRSVDELMRVYRNGSPILVTLVSFWHYAVVRQMPLTPSVAFTSVSCVPLTTSPC